MNSYSRRPGGGGAPSKATPNTLCQKCLKKDIHYSYECKEPRTERPYVSRPSRTQQLLNPKLVPKLMSDETKELLRKKGIADEQLAKKEEERARNRDHELKIESSDAKDAANKRRRSSSNASSASFSSYSTNKSHSRSPSPPRNRQLNQSSRDTYKKPPKTSRMSSKRRRASSSDGDRDERDKGFPGNTSDDERRTRRKFEDASPEARGRTRSPRAFGRAPRPTSRSPVRGHSDLYERDEIPEHNDRRGAASQQRANSRHRHLDSPQAARGSRDERGRRQSVDDDRYGASYKNSDDHRRSASPQERPKQVVRERSLSPFSRRVALTQALNMGR